MAKKGTRPVGRMRAKSPRKKAKKTTTVGTGFGKTTVTGSAVSKKRKSGTKPPGKKVAATTRGEVAYDDMSFAQQRALRARMSQGTKKAVTAPQTANQKKRQSDRRKKAAVKKSS
jgi:hypothetical protein